MANPIQRIVKLVLDRRAAQQTERDAKKNLKGVEDGLARIKKMALAVGASIAAAFGARAIGRFLKDSIRVGAEAQAIWNRLAQAVENAGTNYKAVEQDIHRVASAMQAATKVGDEDFATILTELITTTNDYEKSLKAVDVVVNLAAAKHMDLRAAAQLVGRAMVGQTSTLTRYGIIIKEGEDAMEVLRHQFRGFAENEAVTFEGKLAQLNNAWGDFKEAIGDALIAGAEGETVLDKLTRTVQRLTEAVDIFSRAYGGISETAFRNEQAITRVVASAKTPEAALIGLEAFKKLTEKELNSARENLESMTGLWGTVKGVAKAGDMFTWQTEVDSARETVDGLTETMAHLDRVMRDIREGRTTVGTKLPPSVAPPAAGTGPGRIDNVAFRDVGKPALAFTRPSADAVELSPVTREIEAMRAEMEIAQIMTELTGQNFNSLDAEADRLTNTMMRLAEMGLDPADMRMQGLADRLREVQEETSRVSQEQELLASVAASTGEILNAVFGAGIGPLAASKAKQNAIMAAEQLAMGLVASLNPFTAPKAAGHYAAAGQFAGIAAAWGTLAAATGGFGGGGGGGAPGGFGGGRDVAGAASQRAEPVGPDVKIYLTGEGFDAINPRVQRVVHQAGKIAQQQYGNNTRVRTFRGSIPQGG